MIFGIRDVKKEDFSHLYDCDIKCFDYVWSDDEWEFAATNYAIKVGHWYGTPVGFAVFMLGEKQAVTVIKVGVKPNFRKRGIGRNLFNEAFRFAVSMGAAELNCIVPETLCLPDEPQCILPWLKKMGMKGTGIVKNYLQNEDGYEFKLKRGDKEWVA
jgi:ribosomal protein S18 acetylase RimI-like enzyme